MKPTFSDYLIAYLSLFGGLALSSVAVYYSVVGLVAIYPAAATSIMVMGVVIEVCKLIALTWLKQSWAFAPRLLKFVTIPLVIVVMAITSTGVFGFLSKSHADQGLVSGDIQAKLAVYDEKLKVEKESIEANRRALKQMDESFDQIMGRSTSEQGADKAVAIRKSQQKERARINAEISASQKKIVSLNEERAPIAAENRKVEAEVGPIKYVAALLYGSNPDASLLEKAVILVTLLIVLVIDPFAIMLLLNSQFSFQNIRERNTTPKPVVEEPVVEDTKPEEPVIIQEPMFLQQPDIEPKQELEYDYSKLDYLNKPWKWGKSREEILAHEEPESTYVQNEEQTESNLWSTTTTTTTEPSVVHDEHKKAAELQNDVKADRYAHLVRSRQLDMTEVPEELQDLVKSKI